MNRLNWLVTPIVLAVAIVTAGRIIASTIQGGRLREDRRSLGVVLSQARNVLQWCKSSEFTQRRSALDSALELTNPPTWQRETDGALRVLADSTDFAALQDAQGMRDEVLAMPRVWKDVQQSISHRAASAEEQQAARSTVHFAAFEAASACEHAIEVDSAVATQLGVSRTTLSVK